MGLVWEHEFGPSEQLVMLALADHAHDDGTEIRPSVSRVAWKTGYEERQVQRILKKLRDEIEILVLTKEGGGRGKPNVYRFDWTKGVKKSDFTPKKRVTSGGVKGDTAKSPEPSSLEPSGSRRDAGASEAGAKVPWMKVYCDLAVAQGVAVSDEDRKRLPGNLNRCAMKEGASGQEMHRLMGRMLLRRAEGQVLSPQEALNDVRGIRRDSGRVEAPSRKWKTLN